MAVVLYGLGPAQLHGRLVLGCYRQQVSADQSLGSATALSPRTMLSVFDNRYNRHSQAPNHWSVLNKANRVIMKPFLALPSNGVCGSSSSCTIECIPSSWHSSGPKNEDVVAEV